MNWEVEYLPEAESDLKSLDGSQRILVLKAIKKVKQNPLPVYEGGYGKPLGNKNGNDLTGFLKVKLKSAGLRVVYKVVKQNDKMLIIVIGARADEEVYGIAQKRIQENDLQSKRIKIPLIRQHIIMTLVILPFSEHIIHQTNG